MKTSQALPPFVTSVSMRGYRLTAPYNAARKQQIVMKTVDAIRNTLLSRFVTAPSGDSANPT